MSIGLSITNGRVEPVAVGETTGVSLLQTAGKSRQFSARETLEELGALTHEAEIFVAPVGALEWTPTDTVFVLSHQDLTGDLALIHGFVQKALPIVQNCPVIVSYQVGIGLKSHSYISLSSKYAGGSDMQYYDRLSLLVTGERDGIRQEYYEVMSGESAVNQYSEASIRTLFETAITQLEALLGAPEAPS